MLGLSVLSTLGDRYRCVGLSRQPLPAVDAEWLRGDLTVPDMGEKVAAQCPDVVLHCAAMTNVDECERHPDLATRLHVESTATLADVCSRLGAKLIYVSTDSVFDGSKKSPYVESDAANPLNVYARTKYEGERRTLETSGGLVLRTNIFGWRWKGQKSFSEWVLDGLQKQSPLNMVTDVIYSPIATVELARLVGQCIDAGTSGLFHAAGSEALSKHEFALRVAAAFGLPSSCMRPIKLAEMVALDARRPTYMALDSSQLAAELHHPMPDVDQSIKAWMEEQPTWT